MNHQSDSRTSEQPAAADNDQITESDSAAADVAQDIEQALPIQEHEEEETVNGRSVRRKGIFLLPNLLTTGALFSGFYAILAGMNGHFEVAAIAIFVAMVFDGLDGRVARLTNTQSAFGVEYDSLSDMVSFGVAPAVVSFSWGLNQLGKVGWAIAFIYVSCAALRLARFNTQVGTVDSRYFMGLASPPAAALVAAMVWAGHDTEIGVGLALVAGIITALAGVLMVLNVRYQSFKGLDLRGRVPFVMILVAVFVFVVVSIDPPKILLLMGIAYAASGPITHIVQRLRKQGGG
ncbi:CDP-diacylglycerol--serine O-phosphatidyltransferase [bacterium SCSIO 12696]|nr:CDP-diacylglycerol--serine O-phosphatidyltransferase [bacterium SCSIO 12696]